MINKNELLTRVTEKDIMEFYWGEALVENVAKYKNPTRGDRKGTCYFSNRTGRYYLVDKSRTKGVGIGKECLGCFDFVMWHYTCSFKEALERINFDMNVQQRPIKRVIEVGVKFDADNRVGVAFKVVTRPYTEADYDYWQQFGISPKTLRDFKVRCVSKYHSNSKNKSRWELMYKKKDSDKDLCYVYLFGDRVKLYQPYSQFAKWRGNVKSDDIYGLDLLPIRGKTLYIASGCKDAMCLYEAGLDVIAPQSEKAGISEKIMSKLKSAFKDIVVVYDNDPTGIDQVQLFAEGHGVSYITLPNEYGKDVAEIVNKTNLDYMLNLVTGLTEQINELTNGNSKRYAGIE